MAESRYIRPELRRKVLVEAGHRCAIPRCRSLMNLEIHHIIPYSEVKKHQFTNLIALCPNCHAQADRGEIDQEAMFMYKDNLRYVIDKYSPFEFDVLTSLSRSLEGFMPIPPYLDILVKRIIEAGYVQLAETSNVVTIKHKTSIGEIVLKTNPNILVITPEGRKFIDQLSHESIGYNRHY